MLCKHCSARTIHCLSIVLSTSFWVQIQNKLLQRLTLSQPKVAHKPEMKRAEKVIEAEVEVVLKPESQVVWTMISSMLPQTFIDF